MLMAEDLFYTWDGFIGVRQLSYRFPLNQCAEITIRYRTEYAKKASNAFVDHKEIGTQSQPRKDLEFRHFGANLGGNPKRAETSAKGG